MMSKNYTVIHYIQKKLEKFNPEFVECVSRCFCQIEESKEPDGCLSNTVALYVCAKEYGYSPKICYGLCSFQGKEFYHAWLEIDGIVIDMSIYGNINFCPFPTWDSKLDTPYIGTYEDAFLHYGKFVFDEDWPYALISRAEGWSVKKYMDTAPANAMWKLVCRYLGKTPTWELVDQLEPHIEGVRFERNV